MQRLQTALAFLGESFSKTQKRTELKLSIGSILEFPPSIRLRLKVEANTREHFTVLGLKKKFPFDVNFKLVLMETCHLTTYRLERIAWN